MKAAKRNSWPRPSQKMQRTKFPRELGRAIRLCRRSGLFLLAEADGRGKERWTFFSIGTGEYLSIYFPESRRLLIAQDALRCRGWWEAVELTARRKAFLAARRETSP